MPSRKKISIHKKRFDAIKKHVTFKIDFSRKLSSYEKRKIKKYFDEIQHLKNFPYYDYRPRSEKNKKAARKYARQSGFTEMKSVFIPVATWGDKPTLKFSKKGILTVENRNVSGDIIFFNDRVALATDTENYVNTLVRSFPQDTVFVILNGDRAEIPGAASKNLITKEVAFLVSHYDSGSQWLIGLAAYTFKNQKTYEDFSIARTRATTAKAATRAKSERTHKKKSPAKKHKKTKKKTK